MKVVESLSKGWTSKRGLSAKRINGTYSGMEKNGMTDGRVCPNCNYQRRPGDDDFTPEYECPKCGVIYDKLVPPESVTEENDNKDRNISGGKRPAAHSSPDKGSSGGKKAIYAVSTVVAIFCICLFLIKSSGLIGTSKSRLSGTYAGDVFLDDDERVSLEFDIDKHQRITRIFKRQIRELRSDNVYEVEETCLWEYPDKAEITFTKTAVNDSGNSTAYSLKRKGDSIAVKMNDPRRGFSVDSSFEIHDSENSPPDTQIKSHKAGQDIFYIQFSHNIFKPGKVEISRKDVEIPERLYYEDICRYCNAAQNDIGKVLGEAGIHFIRNKHLPLPYMYHLSPDFNQCSFRLGYSTRPQLKFKILPGEIHSYLQSIYAREMKIDDLSLYADTGDSTLSFELPGYRLFSRISVNGSGCGRFGHPCRTGSIPVSKNGLNFSDEEFNNSAEEWKTVFIKSDPRYKNGTFKAIKARQQKAAGQAMDKMKLAGPEQDDTKE